MPSLRVLSHAFRAWRRNLQWRKHEPETPYLADLLSGAPVCLHVGASDGRHSYVMTQVAPKATIWAIEPSAFSYAVLKTTVAWHRIGDRVTPVHAAVGDRPGEMLLVTPRKLTGRMGRAYAFVAETTPDGEARPDLQDAGLETQPTQVITLDDFCAERGIAQVDFIRMDIEGAELMALQGAERMLAAANPPVWLVEMNGLLHEYGISEEVFCDWMKGRGYDTAIYDADARALHFGGRPWQVRDNVLFIAAQERDAVEARIHSAPLKSPA